MNGAGSFKVCLMGSSDIVCFATVGAEKLMQESGGNDGEIVLSIGLSSRIFTQVVASQTATAHALARQALLKTKVEIDGETEEKRLKALRGDHPLSFVHRRSSSGRN